MEIVFGWIRFGITAVLILGGLFVLAIATVGIHRLDYVLNRIHIAAKCDTLGIMLVLLGLVISGVPLFSGIKMLLIIAFMWLANPVSNHLIVSLEVETNEKLNEHCVVVENEDI